MPVPGTPTFNAVNPIDIDEMVLSDSAMQELYKNDKAAFEDKVTQLYHQSGYTREGTPRPLAQRAFAAIERKTGVPEEIPQMVASMPATAGGAVAGAVVGALAGPAASYVGAGTGTVAGMQVNAALGITDPMTQGDVAIGMAAPFVGPAFRGAKKLVKFLPGGGYGAHKALLETAEEQATKFGITEATTKAGWDVVRAGEKYALPLDNTKAVLTERLQELGSLSSIAGGFTNKAEEKLIADTLKGLENTGVLDNKQVTALFNYANSAKLKEGGEWWGRVAGGLVDDIEQFGANAATVGASERYGAAAVQGAQDLIKASALTKRLSATKELDALLSRVQTPLENDNAIRFNRDQFTKALKAVPRDGKPNVYEKGMGADVDAMIKATKDLGYIVPNPGLTMSTIGREMLPYASMAAGAAHMMGGTSEAYMATMGTGLVLGAVTRFLLTRETGRNWMAGVLKEQGGRITEVQMREMYAALTGAGAGAAAALGSSKDIPASVYGVSPHQVTVEKRVK